MGQYMGNIKMSYIFLEKEKHEKKMMKEIILDVIDQVIQERNDEIFKMDNVDVKYRIIQKANSGRCFLEMETKNNIRCIQALQKIDRTIFQSKEQKYYWAMRDYDGISEKFCRQLYPKIAVFERKIRSFILLIVTKAYGSRWRDETVSEECLNEIKKNNKGRTALTETLENMDLTMLENYLFQKRSVDYSEIINENLSEECLKKLDKEAICSIIDEMRETSLWERLFNQYGSQKKWEERIKKIHNIRNKVAHQKTITFEEFTEAKKNLKRINQDLTNTIDDIRETNFTETNSVDILLNFANLAGNMAKFSIQPEAFKNVAISFNARIQDLVKQLPNSTSKTLSNLSKAYSRGNLGIVQTQMIADLNFMTKNLGFLDELTNSNIFEKIIPIPDNSVLKMLKINNSFEALQKSYPLWKSLKWMFPENSCKTNEKTNEKINDKTNETDDDTEK